MFCFNTWVHAGEITNFGARTPSQEDFIQALKSPKSGAIKYRGIRPVTPKVSQPAEAAVSMQLTFEFDSDKLSKEAKRTLDSLGLALESEELQNSAFRIEGHTDSKGSNAYNQYLSERRARSVAGYLVERFHIEPKRLQSVGKGETTPLYPDAPENPENRRVQIVNLDS
jgi:outer membrane protein OmpA-like peptidoglycan-associated protein